MTGKNIFYLQITNPCIVRMRSVRENIAPNPLVQGLKHLASTDGASAWWFAKVDSLDYFDFLPDPGVSGVRSMGPGVSMYNTFLKLC